MYSSYLVSDLFLHIRTLKEGSFGVMDQIWRQKTGKVMYKVV